jgi:hypothetical protein
MKIGFTGTRNGMTDPQKAAFKLLACRRSPTEFHHGACLGADADAEGMIVCDHVVAHPGKPASGARNPYVSESAVAAAHEVRPVQTHFARNRNIVDETDILIATPWQTERPAKGTGGGTWYTIEYGEKRGKPVHIIWPDGAVSVSNPPPAPGSDQRTQSSASA